MLYYYPTDIIPFSTTNIQLSPHVVLLSSSYCSILYYYPTVTVPSSSTILQLPFCLVLLFHRLSILPLVVLLYRLSDTL